MGTGGVNIGGGCDDDNPSVVQVEAVTVVNACSVRCTGKCHDLDAGRHPGP